VRIYVKPFIEWIWAGCILMALGGAFAIGDKRYRVRVRQTARPESAASMLASPNASQSQQTPLGAE
jgi:cytochrome c-type biogenesis protein CcmF